MAGRTASVYVNGKEHYIVEMNDYSQYVDSRDRRLISKDVFYYLEKEKVAIINDIVLVKGEWGRWQAIEEEYEGMHIDEYYAMKVRESKAITPIREASAPNNPLLLDNLLSDIVSNLDEYFASISIKMEE